MNAYRIIAVVAGIVGITYLLQLGPVVSGIGQALLGIVSNLASVPLFSSRGPSPHIVDLAILAIYVIALVGIVKVIAGRRRRGDE